MKVTEHLLADRTHVVPLNEPGPVTMKVTVPVGGVALPASVSVTVAVQVDGWFTTTGVPQRRLIDVERELTVIDVGALRLLECAGSPV